MQIPTHQSTQLFSTHLSNQLFFQIPPISLFYLSFQPSFQTPLIFLFYLSFPPSFQTPLISLINYSFKYSSIQSILLYYQSNLLINYSIKFSSIQSILSIHIFQTLLSIISQSLITLLFNPFSFQILFYYLSFYHISNTTSLIIQSIIFQTPLLSSLNLSSFHTTSLTIQSIILQIPFLSLFNLSPFHTTSLIITLPQPNLSSFKPHFYHH